jgi:SAM-dependent methyltransferase
MSMVGRRLRGAARRLGWGGDSAASIDVATDPLNRREAGGQLRALPRTFFPAREEILRPIMAEVKARGAFAPELLGRCDLASFDERVVEYPVALGALIELGRRGEKRLLDVGCVLNNVIISDYVRRHAGSIWLWNASLEQPVYRDDLIYVVSDLRQPILPEDVQFDLVTCLSTLEHTGMDNTRYGGKPAEFSGTIADPERFAIAGLRNVARYVAPGGRLLVSVPFGPFEFVYVYGQGDKPIYYTFDRARLEKLAQTLDGFDVQLSAYKVEPGTGWVLTELDDYQTMLRHADGCVSAGGVAFVDAVRR